MNLRDSLILCISTTVLFIIAVFCAWLYYVNLKDVESRVEQRMASSRHIIEQLVRTREHELSAVAKSLTKGTALRSALATGHGPTINGTLRSLATGSGVDFIQIRQQRQVIYTSEGPEEQQSRGASPSPAGYLIGGHLLAGSKAVVVGSRPDETIAKSWSQIIDGRIVLQQRRQRAETESVAILAHTLPETDRDLLKRDLTRPGSDTVGGGGNDYYLEPVDLGPSGIVATVLFERNRFWTSFARRRNQLIIIGGTLLLLGLILSVFLANFINRRHMGRPRERVTDTERILEQIENARERLIREALSGDGPAK